jgi:hypothetical protein
MQTNSDLIEQFSHKKKFLVASLHPIHTTHLLIIAFRSLFPCVLYTLTISTTIETSFAFFEKTPSQTETLTIGRMASTNTRMLARYPSWEYKFSADHKIAMWNGPLSTNPYTPDATEQGEYRIRLRAGCKFHQPNESYWDRPNIVVQLTGRSSFKA